MISVEVTLKEMSSFPTILHVCQGKTHPYGCCTREDALDPWLPIRGMRRLIRMRGCAVFASRTYNSVRNALPMLKFVKEKKICLTVILFNQMHPMK